jgi:processive 1,2-diacylglycerol beta-glucosyltransferase
MEQLTLWEQTLAEIETDLQKMAKGASSLQLGFFERELTHFHHYLGASLAASIFPALTETQRAIVIGRFRKGFQKINDAYAKLKGDQPIHLCCMCHFAERISEFWPINNRVIALQEELPSVSRAASCSSILIFTCGGGRGHLSTTTAMAEYTQKACHILVANTLEETLAKSDVFKKILLDFSQEKLYNSLLKNEEFEWLKLMYSIGPFFLMLQQENIERLIRLEALKQNPDMIISCFPIMNAMFLNVAKELDLPVLFVTTDLDTRFFIKNMDQATCDLHYPRYRMTLAYDDLEMRRIMEKKIPREKIHVTGFPVRDAFHKQGDAAAIRAHFGVQEGAKIILVMMGGNASPAIKKYAAILAELTDQDLMELNAPSLHVICLCGDPSNLENRKMAEEVNCLAPMSPRVKIQGIPATEKIAELMQIAEALITKPGGCTTNEALARKLPMIFHAPFALMSWEVFNMKFCIKQNMGARFKLLGAGFFKNRLRRNKERLVPLLKEAFERRRAPSPSLPDKNNFQKEFMYLVDCLLNKS